ncbi:MAG: DUF3567 family protein [Betaproteobacteria bacterium]|jgi:hypothetical protein
MQMIYNSPAYSVLELAGADGEPRGLEIVDKFSRREVFLEGRLAQVFRDGVMLTASQSPSVEALDGYIGRFEGLMLHPLALH